MSVAALSIAMSSFCTNPKVFKDGNKNKAIYNGKVITNWQPNQFNQLNSKQLIQSMSISIEDIISFVQEDYSNGRMMTEVIAKSYIHNLLDVLSKLEDLSVLTIEEEHECENCDEID